ncbi:MAG: DUF4277 domain-containing protein [Cyanobacteria bacterium P01_G01_bin.39]
MSVKNLEHLGIIAGLIDEMGIVEQINQRLGIDSRKKVSTGVVVKAMLLNGLGFVSAPSSRIPLRLTLKNVTMEKQVSQVKMMYQIALVTELRR